MPLNPRLLETLALSVCLATSVGSLPARARTEIALMASDAIKIASAAAVSRGYDLSNKDFKIDISSKPMAPSYVTTQLYRRGNLVDEYSINTRTLQVVGVSSCEYFTSPKLEAVKDEILPRREREKDYSVAALADELGCDGLTVVRGRDGK